VNLVDLVELHGVNKLKLFHAKTLGCFKAPAPTEIKNVFTHLCKEMNFQWYLTDGVNYSCDCYDLPCA